MNAYRALRDAACAHPKRALPILSFPAVRKLNITVEQLVKTASLQADVMEYIAHATDTSAAVSLMDLSVEAEAFGAQIRFSENEVPVILGQLVSDLDEAQALEVPSLEKGRASVCVEGIRQAKARIQDKPVLAGMIGPYSLTGRLMGVTEVMYICFDEPEAVHAVLEKATDYLIRYGRALRQAGADGLVLAEPLAGILNPDMAEAFSVPYVRRIVQALQDERFAVVYHNCGNAVPKMLKQLFSQGAAAYHFGNAVNMAEILAEAPADALCLGNIDPSSVLVKGTPETVTAAVDKLMAACGGYANFIPSSGCDIPAGASWDNIQAFFAAVAHAPDKRGRL